MCYFTHIKCKQIVFGFIVRQANIHLCLPASDMFVVPKFNEFCAFYGLFWLSGVSYGQTQSPTKETVYCCSESSDICVIRIVNEISVYLKSSNTFL